MLQAKKITSYHTLNTLADNATIIINKNKCMESNIIIYSEQLNFIKQLISSPNDQKHKLRIYNTNLKSLLNSLKSQINNLSEKKQNFTQKIFNNSSNEKQQLNKFIIDNFLLKNTLIKLNNEKKEIENSLISINKSHLFQEPKRYKIIDKKDSNDILYFKNEEMQRQMLLECRHYSKTINEINANKKLIKKKTKQKNLLIRYIQFILSQNQNFGTLKTKNFVSPPKKFSDFQNDDFRNTEFKKKKFREDNKKFMYNNLNKNTKNSVIDNYKENFKKNILLPDSNILEYCICNTTISKNKKSNKNINRRKSPTFNKNNNGLLDENNMEEDDYSINNDNIYTKTLTNFNAKTTYNNYNKKQNDDKPRKKKKINLLSIDELFDVNNYESKKEAIIDEELHSDQENFVIKIKPLKQISINYKNEIKNQVPKINLQQIEYNKVKIMNEADLYSFQKRNFERTNFENKIKEIKQKINTYKKKLKINKKKYLAIKNFIEEIKNNYKVLRPLKIKSTANNLCLSMNNISNYNYDVLKEEKKNDNKCLVGSDYSDEDKYENENDNKFNTTVQNNKNYKPGLCNLNQNYEIGNEIKYKMENNHIRLVQNKVNSK